MALYSPPFFLILSASLRASAAVTTLGSTPTTLPPSAWSAVHSWMVGTSCMPCFRSSQLLSSCFSAWLK